MIFSQQSRLCSFAVSRNRLKCFTLVSKGNITFQVKNKTIYKFSKQSFAKEFVDVYVGG